MNNKILLILISLASLFSVSCFESKINGLEKYNGNVYVSSTIYKTETNYPPELLPEDTEYEANKDKVYPIYLDDFYLWLYIYEGEAYFTNSTSKTEIPDFYTGFYDIGCLVGCKDSTYLVGSGTSYQTPPEKDAWKISLEFSQDGNSAAYTYINKYNSEENKNLELVIFKK